MASVRKRSASSWPFADEWCQTPDAQSMITRKHIESIPADSVLICISPPRLFAAEAIIALDQRKDIIVIFDHVASGLAFIQESLQRDTLRENFIFDEQAAAGYECQYAMGLAAIREAQEFALQGTASESSTSSKNA